MAVEIRELREEDEKSVLAALNEACARSRPGEPPRTVEEWRWAYAANPAGRRAFLALDGGRVVGHYAALPHRVWMDARETLFAEVTDAFALEEYRRGLQRRGVFTRLGEAFYEAYEDVENGLVHYGWTSLPEWRVGKRELEYEVLRTQTVLVRELSEGETEPPEEVRVRERFDHQARWLWDRCSGRWGASVVRDEAFLNWRFADHPRHDYTVYGVDDAEGVLRGYAVYRRCVWPAPGSEPETGLVVDWLVPPDEPEVGELLRRAVLARARADGLSTVTTQLVEWSPWFDAFQRWGFLVLDAGRFLMGRHKARRFDMLWLRDHWWTTLADSVVV